MSSTDVMADTAPPTVMDDWSRTATLAGTVLLEKEDLPSDTDTVLRPWAEKTEDWLPLP